MNLLYLTVLFPLLGYLLLAFSGGRFTERRTAVIGVGSIGLSALVSVWVGSEFFREQSQAFTQLLWHWISVGQFKPDFSLRLDGLSLTMLGVVTGVGFLIHLFAAWYMRGDDGYSRFFAYMNLFVASMLLLVLGDNLLVLYLGWEGVGLCSYLLIGFYHRDSANGAAALKAFIVTRIGDVFLAIALFALYAQCGTLNIQELLVKAPQLWQAGATMPTLIALLLLGGAVGKSAQLPLQTWLADAMAGPTPVSALIHAATMVTAGVYLIARTYGLFLLAPEVMALVALVGAATLLLAGFAALAQSDIKRILAYSTMSQIGYMFLALGVGAWHAAIFHLMTHAFFKALLFLSAGAVIVACHHEQDIFRMGGLRKKLPLVYAAFLVGGSALAALPLVTAGFYSKDAILWAALASGHNNLVIAGLLGAFLTALYTFRLIFIVFHGQANTDAHPGRGLAYGAPLVLLLILSTFVGAWITPPLTHVLPFDPGSEGGEWQHRLEWLSAGIVVIGIALAAGLFLGQRQVARFIAGSAPGRLIGGWWLNAWGFDFLYDRVFVRPYRGLAQLLRHDPIDQALGVVTLVARQSHRLLAVTENGLVRWYVASIAAGAVLVIGFIALN
ncbi:MAG: NADH-quinone oxidoreductase subunit L [Porticoccaceae bacterium]